MKHPLMFLQLLCVNSVGPVRGEMHEPCALIASRSIPTEIPCSRGAVLIVTDSLPQKPLLNDMSNSSHAAKLLLIMGMQVL